MYKGTYAGDVEEIEFVRKFNLNKHLYNDYLLNFNDNENKNLWMVRVTTKQYSQLCQKKVFTRSDCYLVKIDSEIEQVLIKNDYYLSEDILKLNYIKYEKIPFSGVSVKMISSKSFQILKTGPFSFKELFGSFELGAGASLFCLREEELRKNYDLIQGWKTTIENMMLFYDDLIKGDKLFYLNQQICKEIKNLACYRIRLIIDESVDLQAKIFNGVGLYLEPYTAHFFYHGDKIEKLKTIPYSVTTGSGRSKGDYTIVLKP